VSPGSGREGRIFLGEQSGVGEAVVIGLSEDDMIKDADAEDLRGFDQAVCTVAVFARGSGISRRVIVVERFSVVMLDVMHNEGYHGS
jgi:phosphopantetheine adenylyltransferase